MKRLRMSFLFVVAFSFAFLSFQQESRALSSGAAAKDLKRTAHRLHIPIEQVKKARRVLQEATDLARQMKPIPVAQISSLAESWRQLDRSKSKEVINRFIQDLRSEAANAVDLNSYQQATTTAIEMLQSNGALEHEKVLELVKSWPEPPAAVGEAGTKFLRDAESGLRQSALYSLAYTDPVKAKELLAQAGDSAGRNYVVSGEIVQGLVNEGKKDEALALVNQTISDFKKHGSDPQALQEYQSFAQLTIGRGISNDSTIMNPLIEQLKNQAPSENCASGTIQNKDKSVDLTCSEFTVLNMVRSFPQVPGLLNTTLGSFAALKSKLDQAGGIDNIYSGMMNVMPKMPNMPDGMGNFPSGSVLDGQDVVSIGPDIVPGFPMPPMSPGADTNFVDPNKLLRELKDKAESNPEFVKGKLKEAAKGPNGIDILINLAMMANEEDPDLSSLALEIARPLLSQVEPIESRVGTLTSLILAYRKVEGEVDSDFMRDGFALADQLREKSEKAGEAQTGAGIQDILPMKTLFVPGAIGGIAAPNMPSIPIPPGGMPPGEADQLENFLVSELAKDNSEKAIDYARSRKSEAQRLTCLIQIIQALSAPDF